MPLLILFISGIIAFIVIDVACILLLIPTSVGVFISWIITFMINDMLGIYITNVLPVGSLHITFLQWLLLNSMTCFNYYSLFTSYFGGKWGQHSQWMLVWVSSMLDPIRPSNGAEPESYFCLHVVPPPPPPRLPAIRRGRLWVHCTVLVLLYSTSTIVQYDQAYSGQVGGAHQPRLPTHLGEENSDL